jgi:hypothetical protein
MLNKSKIPYSCRASRNGLRFHGSDGASINLRLNLFLGEHVSASVISYTYSVVVECTPLGL